MVTSLGSKIMSGAKGEKANYFGEDLDMIIRNYLQEIILENRGVAVCCFGWYTKAKSSTF